MSDQPSTPQETPAVTLPIDPRVAEFAATYQRFLDAMQAAATVADGMSLRGRIAAHLGTDPASLTVISESFPSYQHPNVQRALDTYLAAPGRRAELIGLLGQAKRFGGLSDLVSGVRHMEVQLGPVEYTNLPIGVGQTMPCVDVGLYLITDEQQGSRPLVLLMRGPNDFTAQQTVNLDLLTPDQDRARILLDTVRELTVTNSVYRGQVLSLSSTQSGGIQVTFHPRPATEREDIVLPARALDRIERHTLGFAAQRERLHAAGRHLKRGLLLHGPPGTGKTLTAGYLTNRMAESTVLLLSGFGLGLIGDSVTLARTLHPSVVILEDVDLVAEERTLSPQGNPLLFELLNEMDGLAADADVIFILTTNRVDLLEPALAARPGRVDEAVELPLPDDTGRRQLIDLYARGLTLHLSDLDAVVARSAGVSPAFIKELLRRAALLSAADQDQQPDPEGSAPLVVEDRHLHAALDELLEAGSALTRSLLGTPTTV